MAAPATMGTGAEPDRPESYLDDGPQYERAEYDEGPPYDGARYEGTWYEGARYEGARYDRGEYEELDPGRRMGWFGIVVLLIAALATAAAAYALINGGFKPKTKVLYQPAAVFSLQTGQCFDGQNGLGITVLSCSSPHEAEVFATFLLPDSPWPGEDAVQAAAQAGCRSRIAGYVNPQLARTALSQEAIYPDEVTWTAGSRTVVCDVRSDDGPITGSVQ